MKLILTFVAITMACSHAHANEMYRSPKPGDKGTYFVLKKNKLGDGTIRVLTSRIGKNNAYTDFTEIKINCDTEQYFELAGGSEDGAIGMPTNLLKDWSKQSKWTTLIQGSSKYDLVQFICKKQN